MNVSDPDPEIIVFSLKKRYTGVSATVNALVPLQAKKWRLAYVGPQMANGFKPISLLRAFLLSARPPIDRDIRIWHLRRNNEMLLGVIARDFLRFPIKLVFTSAAKRRHSRFPRWLISRMDSVICTSNEAAKYIHNATAVVPHGVDVGRFSPPEDKKNAWSHSELPGRWGVGVFGRVRPEKGTDIFVDAMISVLPKYPEFTAVIAGLVQPKFREFYEGLQTKINNAGLSNRIVFLGEVPADQVHLWYQRCLICVACPRYEAFGLTLFEAASSECAVLGSPTGAFADIAIPEETGEMMEHSDARSLEAAVAKLMIDPMQTTLLGKNARRRAIEKFAINIEVLGISKVYDELL